MSLAESFEKFELCLVEADRLNKLVKKAFESDYIGMCTVSIDGKFEQVNEACCEIWERSEEELLNLTYQEITHPDDLATDVNEVHKILSEQLSHYSMAKRYLMPNGKYKPCWLEVSAIKDGNGVFHLFFSKILSIFAVNKIKLELEGLGNGFN